MAHKRLALSRTLAGRARSQARVGDGGHQELRVVGFADANGDWRANLSLAKHRAQRVADALTHEPGPCQTGKRSHLSRGPFWLLSMNGGFP